MEPVGPGISLAHHPHPSTALSGGWPHCLSSGSRVRAPSVEKQAWVLGRTSEKIDGLHTGYSKCLLFPFERNATEFLELPRPTFLGCGRLYLPKVASGGACVPRAAVTRLQPPPASGAGPCPPVPRPGLAKLAHGTPRIAEAENGPMGLVKPVVGFGCLCACMWPNEQEPPEEVGVWGGPWQPLQVGGLLWADSVVGHELSAGETETERRRRQQ